MKKFCLFIFLGTLVLGTAMKALADSRLDGMSADARAVEDMDLIWLYPNKALQYKNTVDIRLTNSDSGYYSTWNGDYNEWGGILKDAGDIGVLGVYSGRPQIENWDAGYSDTYMYQTFGPNQLGYWFQYTANEWTDWSHDGYSMLYSA